MDRNVLLAFALSMAVFTAWIAWQEQRHGPARRAAMEGEQSAIASENETEFSNNNNTLNDKRERDPIVAEDSLAARLDTRAKRVEKTETARAQTSDIEPWKGVLEGERVRVELSNRVGVVTGWRLLDYYETPRNEVNVELLDLARGAPPLATTPLEEFGYGDLSKENYEVEQATSERVVLLLRIGALEIRKIFYRPDDEYQMDIEIEIRNAGSSVMQPEFGVFVPASENSRPDFKEVSLIALANGEVERELIASLGGSGFLGGIFGGDEGPFSARSGTVWAGFDLRYFAGVIIPEEPLDAGVEFIPLEKGKVGAVRLSYREENLAPGMALSHRYSIFIGPKVPSELKAVGNQLEKTISQGWSWVAPLTAFFGWALRMVHGVVPNYGLAIILLTILVRLATWPIMARQMKSSERMRELMPQIKELQEKYKDDRQKQSEETFKLYREKSVNPLGGCLPMVLQLPVFIGLFYALQSSIDLRHANFIFWINDLSAPATLFTIPGADLPVRLLPILMAASMYGQQKMMPQTGMDPAQAKMMLIMMPGMMLLVSYTFPSGLVLYWFVSNLLGIGHQLLVRRKMQAASGQ